MKYFLQLIACLFLATNSLSAQNFEIDTFNEFLAKNKNLTAEGLLEMYPAGKFLEKAPSDFSSACFSREIDSIFTLTAYEKLLIEKHGFMVTERQSFRSFGAAYDFIFTKDLPVYVSSDAILHALHMSYDDILKGLERDILIPELSHVLDTMRQQFPALSKKYAAQPEMKRILLDLDLYITVPLALLTGKATPVFPENTDDFKKIWAGISSQTPQSIELFSATSRIFDFSQFTPRGHYTESIELTRYFKTMIWLGKTELMLSAPENTIPKPSPEDIQRQTVLSVLVAEMVESAGVKTAIDGIESVISSLVGEQDNVTLSNLTSLTAEAKILNAADLFDKTKLDVFQNILKTKAYSFQRINSQILMGDPFATENIQPPSAFLLFGQRFVVDSYILANLVHDKTKKRMLPSTLDILFAFGNDASARLLQTDMNTFKEYPPNAAALRYLVDSYDKEFWSQSFYNGWLHSIRTLNPPKERGNLPQFMQTAAWWQKTMNTQLSSWTQLRHDNLLYAKQSYSAGAGCSFPESFVEPVPDFYASIGTLAENTIGKLDGMTGQIGYMERIKVYFKNLKVTMDTLKMLSQKELSHVPFDETDRKFLRSMIYEGPAGCTKEFTGWFPQLFFTGEEGLLKDDRVVADVHTSPTDIMGNTVGWVKHVGTGPVNLSVIITENAEGQPIAFAGATMSYYEHTTDNFKRLSDEEWNTAQKQEPSARPAFVDLYLANSEGNARSEGEVQSLASQVSEPEPVQTDLKLQVHPNPVELSTTISFAIPPALSQQVITLKIFNFDGTYAETIFQKELPDGNYAIQWNSEAKGIAIGTYFLEMQIGEKRITQKIILTGK